MKKIYAFFLAVVSLGSAANSQTVIPESDELILPQYAYFGGNSKTRIPFVCRLKITGLSPSSTYRYFTGLSSDGAKTTQAPGSTYRINNTANIYGHVVGLSVQRAMNGSVIQNDVFYTQFASPSWYAEFTTDASGNYTGWFAAVLVGTAGQLDVGSNAYFYVQVNNGSGGTSLSRSFRTTSTVKLLDYSSVAGNANGGTSLIGTSNVGDEKIVTIYDNTAGTGRPLYCTFTENNNCASCSPTAGQLTESTVWTFPTIYPLVDNVSGSWAAIIPNTLSGGVKCINFLNIADATPITLSNAPSPNTSADGTWNGVSTANPAGDSTRPIVINSIAGSGTLPVKLLSFDGKMAKDGIQLLWTTTQETKNKHFDIMRAGTDGKFSSIGRVNAAKPSALTNNYEFFDNRPNSGKNLYQLKQVDDDGTSTFSKVVTIDNQKAKAKMRVVSQSPTELVVAITTSTGIAGRLVYSDASGRVLYSKQVTLTPGENALNIPVAPSALQMGVLTFSSAKGDMMQLKLIR